RGQARQDVRLLRRPGDEGIQGQGQPAAGQSAAQAEAGRLILALPLRGQCGRPGVLRLAVGGVLAALLLLAGPAAIGTDLPDSEGGCTSAAARRASYHSSRLHGRHAAGGEPYDESDMTADAPTLAFGSRLCVTNLFNGRSTAVRVNDRGPFVGGRIIDVSLAAARELGMLRAGTARVRVKTCDEDNDEDN